MAAILLHLYFAKKIKMPKINRTYCSVYGCLSNNIKNPDYSFFSIPSKPDLRLHWLQAISRMDLVDGYRYHRVCEEHFQPEDILVKATRRLLKKNVVPSLRLPVLNLGAAYFPEVQMDGSEDIEEIKQEIEDSFSEHEEDIMEALENRKRKGEGDPLAGLSKAIKIENQDDPQGNTKEFEPQPEFNETTREYRNVSVDFIKQQFTAKEMETSKPKVMTVDTCPQLKPKEIVTVDVNRENDVFPIDFMKSVLNSQEEILKVLKSHVLLESPDPDLLTFLRLVGAKLSRLDPEKRKKMQNAIINLIR